MDLPSGVRVRVRPLSTAIMNAAQSNVIKQIKALQADAAAEIQPNMQNEDSRYGLSEALLVKALAVAAIIEWEGVMNAAGDEAAAVDDKSVCDLMDIWFVGQEFWKQYTTSYFALEVEGNESRPGANGTTAAGLDTAPAA
ncbi:MAG: hypothetical protein EBV03_07185 [Proteobacteria bacterium]|nr:hypothetical protein [Pseudomonadota bacterium]